MALEGTSLYIRESAVAICSPNDFHYNTFCLLLLFMSQLVRFDGLYVFFSVRIPIFKHYSVREVLVCNACSPFHFRIKFIHCRKDFVLFFFVAAVNNSSVFLMTQRCPIELPESHLITFLNL